MELPPVFSPDRRSVLAGLGVGALSLAGLGVALGGGAAELPELPALAQLPIDRSVPGIARASLEAAALPSPFAGNLIAYGGHYPGPLIRLTEGERLRLTFRNRSGNASNLHFHGLQVDPTGCGDNPWTAVPDGADFDYDFAIPSGNHGLHWYHPHLHGQARISGFAQMRGLVGAFLVKARAGDGLPACDDRILVLHDMAIEDGQIVRPRLNDWAIGHEGSRLMVNGVERARITARQSWLRLRLVNASNARYWRLVPSDGAPLIQVAQDGNLLAEPETVEEIFLPPGARSEVMIDIGTRSDFGLHYRPYDRVGRVSRAEFPLLEITRGPEAGGGGQPLPERLADWPLFDPAGATRRREVPIGLLNICGQSYDGGRVDFAVERGSSEIWTLRNRDFLDHPLHLHTWRFEILARNGRPASRRARLDTLNLKPGDSVEIAIRFDRFGGRSLFHCHIVEHAEQGMMAVIDAA